MHGAAGKQGRLFKFKCFIGHLARKSDPNINAHHVAPHSEPLVVSNFDLVVSCVVFAYHNLNIELEQ